MKKKRTWIIIGIIVVLVAAGGVYFATRQTANGQAGRNFLANAQTAKVVRTTLSNSVDSTGSLNPESKVSLSFGTSGTVAEVKAKVGDHVKQGEVLASLDATDLQQKVAQAEQSYLLQQLTYSDTIQADPRDLTTARAAYSSTLAAYNAAQQDYKNQALKQSVQCAQLTTAQNNLDRAQTAYDRVANDSQAKKYLNGDWGPFQSVVNNLTNAQSAYALAVANCNITKTGLNDSSLRSAQAQVQSAKTNLDNLIAPRSEKLIQAKAQLEQSRLSLVQAKNALADAEIVAPFDGIITAVNITTGGASGSSAAVEIADIHQLHVDVLVDETQIGIVQPGQIVNFTLDALPGITVTGKVDAIDPAGTISQGVVNYNVRVLLDPTDAPLKLDMTANASIIGETHENVLSVPTTAIRTGGFGGQGGFTGQGGFPSQGGQGRQNDQSGANVQGGQGVTSTQGGQRIQGPFVLLMRNGQPQPVQVTEGLTVGDMTEVSGDLQEGDQVLIITTTRTTTGAAGGPPGGGFFPGGGRPPFD
jgi:HlyD family secretion protein